MIARIIIYTDYLHHIENKLHVIENGIAIMIGILSFIQIKKLLICFVWVLSNNVFCQNFQKKLSGGCANKRL